MSSKTNYKHFAKSKFTISYKKIQKDNVQGQAQLVGS